MTPAADGGEGAVQAGAAGVVEVRAEREGADPARPPGRSRPETCRGGRRADGVADSEPVDADCHRRGDDIRSPAGGGAVEREVRCGRDDHLDGGAGVVMTCATRPSARWLQRGARDVRAACRSAADTTYSMLGGRRHARWGPLELAIER